MNKGDKRTQKVLALQAAMSGNTQPLLQLKAEQGRPYTDLELEDRQQYMTSLTGSPATRKDVINFFGRYEPTQNSDGGYLLPNGMLLHF